uniref:Uncharacterized protein MANES_16G069800 n=1 Tax=Rhizophora mucronata TaxID=61149 RepID=A0A2P2MYM1_RHIMU
MAATSAAATREWRRKKIMDKGADRLALITGQIQTLPLESPEMSDVADSSRLSDNDQTADRDVETFVSSKHDAASGASHGRGSLISQLPEDRMSTEPPRHPDSRAMGMEQEQPLLPSTDQRSAVPDFVPEQQEQPLVYINKFVTPKQISSAIAATVRPRQYCSIIIALLVVLLHSGFPLPRSNVLKSIISFGPLYLVLLTNLALVLVQLLFNSGRGGIEVEDKIPSSDKLDWAEQAGKALELGLLMQTALDAIFTDCGAYAVILICGLSILS